MAKEEKIHLLFYDPMHQIHNSIAGYMRQPKWRGWTKIIKSNTWRNRVNIMWWIDVLTQEFVWDVLLENCDKETTQAVLRQIRNHYWNEKRIVIILDNARYQRNYETQELALKLWIELVFLPAYAPNLNLIERLWKYMKKKLIANTYYETFQEFYTAICNFLENLWRNKSEVERLINGKFQIINCV